jgi:hypothetical protein
MLTAMQAFLFEVSGNYADKISAGGFVFHVDRVGKISIVLATSADERPSELMSILRTRFLHKYGSYLANFSGVINKFDPFKEDVEEILNLKGVGERIEPKEPLNAFIIMSLNEELQNTAREIILLGEATAQQLSDKLTQSLRVTKSHLERLVAMGHIGRIEIEGGYKYYIDK